MKVGECLLKSENYCQLYQKYKYIASEQFLSELSKLDYEICQEEEEKAKFASLALSLFLSFKLKCPPRTQQNRKILNFFS